jgi:hypothetical protein
MMKKFKALLSFTAISLGVMSMSLNAAVINVPVVSNAWTFIGVPGFQTFGASGASSTEAWSDNYEPTIIDGSSTLSGVTYTVGGLEVPTWDGNYSAQVTANGYATIDDNLAGTSPAYPRDPNGGQALGSNIYATIGLMVIGQSSGGAKNAIDGHNGATVAALRPDTKMYKSTTSAMRTMYIRTADSDAPDIKVYYQANQEGNTFRFQYGTSTSSNALDVENNTVYAGTFDRTYTYDNAAVVGEDFLEWVAETTSGAAGSQVRHILHAFDMNLTDNNLTTTRASQIEPNLASGTPAWTTYGDAFDTNASLALRSTLDGNLTVLWYDSDTQQWRQYRASGDGSTVTVNDASDAPDTHANYNTGDLEAGRGYWVKLDTGVTGTDRAGFVLGTGTIEHNLTSSGEDGAYINETLGWNMLSFEDDYLSYSVTGVLLTQSYGELNVTDTYGATTLSFGAIDAATVGTLGTECAKINAAIDGNNSKGLTNTQLKCIPGAAGLALVSTRRFTIGSDIVFTTETTLAGQSLTAETNPEDTAGFYYKSIYGEHALVFEQNTVFTDAAPGAAQAGRMLVEFVTSTNGGEYADIPTPTAIATTASNVVTAMGTASSDISATNNTFALDMDFDGVAESVLMASDYRFFIKDATQVRVFEYDNTYYDSNVTDGASNQDLNVTIQVLGDGGASANAYVTLVDDALDSETIQGTTTANGFDQWTATTGVTALDISAVSDDNDTLMIYYNGDLVTLANRAGVIDVQEWGTGYDVLTEVYPENFDDNESAKGSIARVWQISDIVETKDTMQNNLSYDGNYSDNEFNAYVADLRFNALYAENFPVSGPLYDLKTTLGVKPETIITGQTDDNGNFISWKQIDVSKAPDEWYDTDDQYELFWTEKEKGYWVYIDSTSTNPLSMGTPSLSNTADTVYAHFNNRFYGSSTSATTRNHLNKQLTVTIDGLTDGGAASNSDAYEVYANIGGAMTSFDYDGNNQFSMFLNSHETNGIDFDAGELEITVVAAEGSGNKVSTTYILDYAKPVITNIAVDGATATATVTNDDAVSFQIYSGDINDSKYGNSASTNWAGEVTLTAGGTAINLGDLDGLTFPTAFENNATAYVDPATALDTLEEQISEGVIRDVRIVAVDDAYLYSDQERVTYVPWKSGTGVLSSSTAGTYDSAPNVWEDDGTADEDYDGSATASDGVQLTTFNSSTPLTCVYPHIDVANPDDTPITNDIYTTSGQVGTILYNNLYVGKPLICQSGSTLYVGGFTAATNDTIQLVELQATTTITKE